MPTPAEDFQFPPEYYEDEDIDDLPNYAAAISSPRRANFGPSSRETHAAPGTLRPIVDDTNHDFFYKSKHFSMTFANQPPTGPRPIYGRGAALQGVLTIFKPSDVTSVFLKFEAKMFYAVDTYLGAEENDVSLLEETLKVFPKKEITSPSRSPTRLFFRGSTSIQQSDETCPHELPFTLPVPSSYSHEGTFYLLPPTYSVRKLYKGITVRVRYEFKVIIARKSTILDRTASVAIPILYAPRSQPSMPIRNALPDDWKVFTVRSDNSLPNDVVVQAFLTLPGSQVYPVDTKIPFYLQLWSTSPSTLAMYVQEPPSTTGNARTGVESETAHIEIKVLRSFRLNMLSQPNVKIKRALAIADIWRCGDELQPAVQGAIQLAQADTTAFSVQNGNACMSWQGEFIVPGDAPLWGDCTGFLAPNVFIRDLIVLRIIPPKLKDHPLKRIEYFIPVRFTTDPYMDRPVHGMDIVQSQI